MAVLVLVAWGAVFLAALEPERTLREAGLVGFTAVIALTVVITEALSLLRLLTPMLLTIAWAVAALAAVLAGWTRITRGFRRLKTLRPNPLDRWDWITGGILAVFLVGTLGSALLYPTTNYDSLTYHMPRVFFWLQNHSVGFFPTPEGRQLFSSVLVEYVALNLKALANGSDRLVNLAQWTSYLFTIVAASLIAKQLGAERRGQQATAVAVAVMPMALLQASTTQNDLTCALWSLVAIFGVLVYVGSRPGTRAARVKWAIFTGTALALAFQSKAPAYVYCAPFLVWLAIKAIRRDGVRSAATLAALVLVPVIVLGAGGYVRNGLILDGDVLALNAPTNSSTVVSDKSPLSLLTNALMNGATLLGTPSAHIDAVIDADVVDLIKLYSGKVPAQVQDWGPFEIPRYVTNHDFAPAPLYVLLLLCITPAILSDKHGKRAGPNARSYALCATFAWLLAAGLFTWNPWINRVLLGGALLWAPLVGVAVTYLGRQGATRWLGVVLTVLALSVVWGALALVFNATNPLAPLSVVPGRAQVKSVGYWNTPYRDLSLAEGAPVLGRQFATVARAVSDQGLGTVGLDVRAADYPIYPLLSLLQGRRVFYVGKTVLADRIPADATPPQATVTVLTPEEYQAKRREFESQPGELTPPLPSERGVIIVRQDR